MVTGRTATYGFNGVVAGLSGMALQCATEVSVANRSPTATGVGKTHVQLGLTGLLGLHAAQSAAFALPDEITVNLGHYQGLQPNTANREVRHVNFRF